MKKYTEYTDEELVGTSFGRGYDGRGYGLVLLGKISSLLKYARNVPCYSILQEEKRMI